MSRQFSQFPDGNPPLDTDRFLIGRADAGSPTGWSNYIMTWAEIKAAVGGGGGTTYNSYPSMVPDTPDDPMEPFMLPGAAGTNGIIGRDGAPIFLVPDLPDDPADPMMIPGPAGNGTPGTNGLNGAPAPFYPFYDPEEPNEPLMIPGPQGPKGASGGGGGANVGTATLDFGAFPGASDASVAVIGQAAIVAGSVVQVQLFPADTADHLADEHRVETLTVFAGNIVAGVGFTIYGQNDSQLNEPVSTSLSAADTHVGAPHAGGVTQQITSGGTGTRIYGKWNVSWIWA